MDPFFILAIILSTVIFIIVPLVCIGLIYFWTKKKTEKKVAVTISFILTASLAYFIITNFFPNESFYVDNFEENTELTLPNSKSLIKYSGNNSIYSFGDYNISYSYKFTPTDYDHLYNMLISKGLHKTETYLETEENEKILNNNASLKMQKILTKDFGFKNFDILFMDDNQTIIFNSNKW